MGGLSSELLLALSKKLNSECFATLSANITGAGFAACLFSKKSQTNTRKYLGVVLRVNDMDYFAPLSSHKVKHDKMKESLDSIDNLFVPIELILNNHCIIIFILRS